MYTFFFFFTDTATTEIYTYLHTLSLHDALPICRQVWVSITAEGSAALSSAPDMMQDRFQSRFDNLPDWEQAMIVAMLERLTGLLDADGIDAAPVIDAGRIDRP